MLGSEWIWKKTLSSQDTAVLQEQLVTLQRLREQFPVRRRKYERMISAVASELARRAAGGPDAAQQPDQFTGRSDGDEARAQIIDQYNSALKRQHQRFAGEIHNEADERGVRLAALLDATFELYRLHVPGMDVALKNLNNRRNMAQNLTAEYMPFMMLDPSELPRAFAEYHLWQFGTDQAIEQIVDIEYLKEAFQRGISLLPEETRKVAISSKHRFEWGKWV